MSPTVADLSKRMDEQLAEEASALAELEALHRNRTQVLLSGSDKALADHDAKITGAKARLERSRAWIATLQDELEKAHLAEVEGPRRAKYDLVQRKAAAVTRRLSQEYPDLAQKLAALLSDLRACNAEVESVNAELPASALPLATPEAALRSRLAEPRKIISDREIQAWVSEYRNMDEEGRLSPTCVVDPEVDPDRAALIHPLGDGRGRMEAGFPLFYIPCTVRKVVWRGATPAVDLEPLDRTVNLPGLRPGDSPIWQSVPEPMIGGLPFRAFTVSPAPLEVTECYFVRVVDEGADEAAEAEMELA